MVRSESQIFFVVDREQEPVAARPAVFLPVPDEHLFAAVLAVPSLHYNVSWVYPMICHHKTLEQAQTHSITEVAPTFSTYTRINTSGLEIIVPSEIAAKFSMPTSMPIASVLVSRNARSYSNVI